ncbi:hypothetical protein LZ318_33760 [Saccharopolyspora indica]|uniref:hypothetical protein n=1 Tax=Saccharopolyspora indica TaxID=1229659 RepID=UPI0022EB5A86|nr:hypothetical protein [Saccharopolyspora indica]MDA3649745.1 hypothetical protein [Saccharopolyspora indica]
MGFAEDLISGPRGRRLCFNVLAGQRQLPTIACREVMRFLGSLAVPDDWDFLAGWEESAFLEPLGRSVDSAMYWQEPDEVDRALAAQNTARALLPIARAIAAAPGARWWLDPLDLDRQFHAEFPHTEPPRPARTPEDLAEWRASTVEDERSADERPADPAAPFTGIWWSTPGRRPVHTTRALPGMGPLGLCLEEDGFSQQRAWCRSVRPVRTPGVYEITGPAAWSELAERYPLEVSRSRRHDWWKVSGWEGPWVIPDWTLVAADHDAVHLTVAGYLTTAGRALPAAGARTMLAGWDPDQTFWLTDALTVGPATAWHGEPGELTTWAPGPG